MEYKDNFNYEFIDRRNHSDKLLIILAGYKPYLWDKVFGRLINNIDLDLDVCILTSGLQNKQLMKIAEDMNWSYLSTDINNLCLAQNICIELFEDAQYIFKMDEDIFTTKHCFSRLFEAYCLIKDESQYVPSCVVPKMNVNCVTYRQVLKEHEQLEIFEKMYGRAYITNGLHHHKNILEDPEIAKFIWSHVNIDRNRSLFLEEPFVPCPVRFSIGMIMFEREMWLQWGKFQVLLDSEHDYERKGMGIDEREICKFAMSKSMPLMIVNSVLVGHFSYGPQTEGMKEFFEKHPELF